MTSSWYLREADSIRRFLCHLATNAASLGPVTRRRRHQVGFHDLARLGKIEQEASYIQFDHRLIREDAIREAGSDGVHPNKRIPRPFNLLVLAQQEKHKRDKHARDRLSREKRQEQYRHEKREDYLNKAMHSSKPQPGVSKAHRNKKSMSSAFFQFMRPISSAFTSETAIPSGPKRTAEELDFLPTGKPALVLSLADCRVAQFINNERSFTFQLDTEDGGHYLLQAATKKDMTKWMNKISHVAKTAAKRRLTYLGSNANLAEQLAALDLNTRGHACRCHSLSHRVPHIECCTPRSPRCGFEGSNTEGIRRRPSSRSHSFHVGDLLQGSRVSRFARGWNL